MTDEVQWGKPTPRGVIFRVDNRKGGGTGYPLGLGVSGLKLALLSSGYQLDGVFVVFSRWDLFV